MDGRTVGKRYGERNKDRAAFHAAESQMAWQEGRTL
jgi:hypothetical protein